MWKDGSGVWQLEKERVIQWNLLLLSSPACSFSRKLLFNLKHISSWIVIILSDKYFLSFLGSFFRTLLQLGVLKTYYIASFSRFVLCYITIKNTGALRKELSFMINGKKRLNKEILHLFYQVN